MNKEILYRISYTNISDRVILHMESLKDALEYIEKTRNSKTGKDFILERMTLVYEIERIMVC